MTMGDQAAYDQFRDRYYERTLELNDFQFQFDLDEMEFKTDACFAFYAVLVSAS